VFSASSIISALAAKGIREDRRRSTDMVNLSEEILARAQARKGKIISGDANL
jgi:hypothetical protein